MGYSVFVTPKSVKERDKMLKFLEKNLADVRVLLGYQDKNEEDDGFGQYVTDDPSYDGDFEGQPLIGFDYNCGGQERFYIFAVCYWMALRLNIKKEFKVADFEDQEKLPTCPYLKVDGEFHYIVYDGCEYFPFRVSNKSNDESGVLSVNENGIRLMSDEQIGSFRLDFVDYSDPIKGMFMSKKKKKLWLKKIDEELNRLTKLWEKENE